MKKTKRILAVIAVLFLISLPVCTFIFALGCGPETGRWFKASLFCMIVIPVLCYGYVIVYRGLKGKGASKLNEEENND